MNNNKKIFIVSVIIIILLAVLFATVKFINKKSKPDGLTMEREVVLYFSTKQALSLKPEKRMIKGEGGQLYQNVFKELKGGPKSSSLNPTIPEGVELINIVISDEGVARLNFNSALRENHWGGSTGERLTVYSIVNTYAQFSNIERVNIVIEGENQETLVGHMVLSIPLAPDQQIVEE